MGASVGAALCGADCSGDAAGALGDESGFFVVQPAAMISSKHANVHKSVCFNLIRIHLSCDDFFLLSPKKENICMAISNISWHIKIFYLGEIVSAEWHLEYKNGSKIYADNA